MASKQRALAFLLILLASPIAASSPGPSHFQRRDYSDEVCKPATTSASDPTPPCVEVENIEGLCAPNGTAPIYIEAHAECMCTGSYFSEWAACQDCLFLHGIRTGRGEAFFKSVEAVASHSLCDFLSSSGAATPTAAFADVFSAVALTLSQPTTGATVSSDQAVSQTAVSLYYTASGSQGPGQITGAAATATATGSTTVAASTSEASTTSKASGSGTSTKASGASSSGSSTSSSAGGAQPTKAAGGLLLGLAGLVVAAGLLRAY